MILIIIIISILFSLCATAIMSYIAMATSTGPWIEPTLVLFGIIIFRGIFCRLSPNDRNQAIGFSTVSGAIGGIIAVACSWTIPTLYFLDKTTFYHWFNNPYYFASTIALVTLSAGFFGFLIAHLLEHHLLDELNLSFPIGELVHKMIFAQDQLWQTITLCIGALITTIIMVINKCSHAILDTIKLIPALSYGLFTIPAICLRLDLLPIFLSIGFVTGHVIAIPLLFGLVSKIILIEPLQRYFFAHLAREIFFNSFVSGIVLQGALLSLLEWPRMVFNTFKQAQNNHVFKFFNTNLNDHNKINIVVFLCLALLLSLSLYYFHFSLAAQIYLVVLSLMCTYQVLLIAGKTGLAPFPRFATFVLIPGMILFGFDVIQITVVSAFVEICCAVAVDVIFGRKTARLSAMDTKKTALLQILGLIVSALSIGIIFYVLIKKFDLGSAELCAQRAQARAFLVQTNDFNYIVALMGGIFGFSLKYIGMNYLLVIGSLLMQPELSISLILGGLLTYAVYNKESWYPFWSGVFAAGSLLMIIHAFL